MNRSYHYVFIISQLWLTSHSRSTEVLDTGTPGTSRKSASSSPIIGILTVNFSTGTIKFLYPVEPLYFLDEKSTTVEE